MNFRIILLSLFLTLLIQGAELTSAAIRKAYYSSYELEKQQRYPEALRALDVVAKSYPQGYTVNYRRGWLSYLAGNYAEAKKFYQIALTQYPSSLEIRKGLVLVEVARKSWKEVEQHCRIGRTIDYYNVTFSYWQSVALRWQGQYSAAQKIAEEMLVYHPTNTDFLLELARAHVAQKKNAQAVPLLESVFVLDPYNQEAVELSRIMKTK